MLITTSDFSGEACTDADLRQGTRVRRIDGKQIASLMVDCGLGVNEERVYRTYRIDGDFFESED